MNTTLVNPFSQVKRLASIAWLNLQIRDLNRDMEQYRQALNSVDGQRHCTYITGQLKHLIRQQRALCDRRDALRGHS